MILLLDNLIEGRNLAALRLLLKKLVLFWEGKAGGGGMGINILLVP